MAVWTPELTRDAVFEAIRKRRTYGSTGSRIYLEFLLNGEPMGGEVGLAPGDAADIEVTVAGTGRLRWIEILRADLDRPDDGFTVAHRQWYWGPTRCETRGWSGATRSRRRTASTTCGRGRLTMSTAASRRLGPAPSGYNLRETSTVSI